jgi:hypothetical protein
VAQDKAKFQPELIQLLAEKTLKVGLIERPAAELQLH